MEGDLLQRSAVRREWRKPGALLCLWNARSYLTHQKPKEHHALDRSTDLLLPSLLQLGSWGSGVLFFIAFPVKGGDGTRSWLLLCVSSMDTYLHQLSFYEAPFEDEYLKLNNKFCLMKTHFLPENCNISSLTMERNKCSFVWLCLQKIS